MTAQSDTDLDYPQLLARLVPPERFPHLAEITAAGAFTPVDDDAEFGLERLLDAVGAMVASAA
jgi:hypothetical protein